MRIVLVNKFYYPRGGDCTAVLGLEKLLRENGHETAIFSVSNPLNKPSAWVSYFPSPVDFYASGVSGKFTALTRLFHSTEVSRQFNRLITDFRPDVVHLHNIHSYISPIVAQIARKRGMRIVWTLHDFKLVCPSYSCLRDGATCEACFRNKFPVVRYKCMKNSLPASIMAYLEAIYWNRKKLSAYTDTFISPSAFLKSKMIQAGFRSEQIEVLPNFLSEPLNASTDKADYYCYVGRLSPEKGVETLLEAARRIPYELKIIGGGPLLDAYRERYACDHIKFYGQLKPEALFPVVGRARFLVMPSICYENNPFSVIEALSMGTPVLGAHIGGIPELIEEGLNGLLFRSGDIADLTEKIEKCFQNFTPFQNFQIISEAAQNKFGSASFYRKLMKIYDR